MQLLLAPRNIARAGIRASSLQHAEAGGPPCFPQGRVITHARPLVTGRQRGGMIMHVQQLTPALAGNCYYRAITTSFVPVRYAMGEHGKLGVH